MSSTICSVVYWRVCVCVAERCCDVRFGKTLLWNDFDPQEVSFEISNLRDTLFHTSQHY
jgi:hypothetical protein